MKTGLALVFVAALLVYPMGVLAEEAQKTQEKSQAAKQEDGASCPTTQKSECKVIKRSDCKYSGIPGKWSRDHQVGPDYPAAKGITATNP